MKNPRINSRGGNTRNSSYRTPITRTGTSQGQWMEEHDGDFVQPRVRNTVRTTRPMGTGRTGNGNFVEPTWSRNTNTVNDVTYTYPTGRTGGQRFRGNTGWSKYGNFGPSNMNINTYDEYDSYEDDFTPEDEFVHYNRPVRSTFRTSDPYVRGSWSNEEEMYEDEMMDDTYGMYEENFVDEGYVTDRGYTQGGYPVNERYPVTRGSVYNGPRETTHEFTPTRRVKVPVSRTGNWRGNRNTRY